jgi:hypothetical protein
MLAPQGAHQELESVRILIVLFAITAVIFWRVVLRVTLMVTATVIVILLTSGAVAFFQGIHHIIK